MSEFFNVTLYPNIVIDDGTAAKDKVWSSEQTLKEIVDNRITKFEELQDVDVVNKKDKQLVAYSENTGKFITINGTDAGDMIGAEMKQVSKMGLVTGHVINIPINTLDFKVPQVNVLKFKNGTQDVVTTQNNFTNAEASDFETDNMIIFDGKAHLKTEFEYLMQQENNIYSCTLDISQFKDVLDVGIENKNSTIKIKAIPQDRLLIPKGDLNLSNAHHIDFFKLVARGQNMKVVCSIDRGNNWKTFRGGSWADIGLTVDNVKKEGINFIEFNGITDLFWNQLITGDKIRFAYLFSLDNITSAEELDELQLQYDGKGYWIQAKENEFDVIYASNTLLQVVIHFDADVKVNYSF